MRFRSRILALYQRNRRLLNNIVGTYLVKGVALVVSLFTLPAYMRYFSDYAVLGAWFVLVSILQWVLTFDLGIGNSLRNLLVPALHARDWPRVRRYVSSGYALAGILSLALLGAGLIALPFVDWQQVLGMANQEIPNSVLGLSVGILLVGIVGQFFLRLVTSVLLAMERAAIPNLLTLISALTILAFVLVFPATDVAMSLLALTVANVVLMNAPLLVATVIVFRWPLRDSRPRLSDIDRTDIRSILALGGRFFWIQLMLLVASGTNEILIAYWYGSASVVEYQVYYRLFFLLVTLFSLVSNPIWSAVSSRLAGGRMRSIRSLMAGTLIVSLMMTAANSVLVVVGQMILDIWLGADAPDLEVGRAFLFVFWSAITMSNMAVSAIANGLGLLRVQLYGFAAAAALKFPLAFAVSWFYPDWSVVVLVNGIVLLPYTVMQLVALRRFFYMGEAVVRVER